MNGRRLILVELNEINFDVVGGYLKGGSPELHAFRRLMAGHGIRTISEERYETLEPWIQWVSVHTGRPYVGHSVFRLGDIVSSEVPQVFEQLEQSGVRVGAVSPMNAANRLREPAYFLPDPWTSTPSDSSWWSRVLTSAISQAVNDNAQSKITVSSAVALALGVLRFASAKNYGCYLKLLLGARRAPWKKALFLDLFIHDLHMRLFSRRKPEFSVAFFNAGAHIQHHYFLNSAPVLPEIVIRNPAWYIEQDIDPIAEMLEVYDRIIADYLALNGTDVIIATGLSQRPYDRVKFYFRLRDHESFLRLLMVDFKSVLPRMTRDFLVEFKDPQDATKAQQRLSSLLCTDGVPLFAEIDNRGSSLFVTLTYPNEITEDTQFLLDGRLHRLKPHVAFVAIKNGMHQPQGFAYFTEGVAIHAPADGSHVGAIYHSILNFFGVGARSEKAGKSPADFGVT